MVFFCGSIMFFSVLCLLCSYTCLFICALWSPTGKGLTSWLSFVVCHFRIGILVQVKYLIVSIPDLCTLTYFVQDSHVRSQIKHLLVNASGFSAAKFDTCEVVHGLVNGHTVLVQRKILLVLKYILSLSHVILLPILAYRNSVNMFFFVFFSGCQVKTGGTHT